MATKWQCAVRLGERCLIVGRRQGEALLLALRLEMYKIGSRPGEKLCSPRRK